MQNHEFVDDFVIGPAIEERIPLQIAEFGEEVQMQKRSPFPIGKCILRMLVSFVAFTVRAVRNSVRSVQWASEPARKKNLEQPHPGAVLEFMLVGLLLVCGLMSTLI